MSKQCECCRKHPAVTATGGDFCERCRKLVHELYGPGVALDRAYVSDGERCTQIDIN